MNKLNFRIVEARYILSRSSQTTKKIFKNLGDPVYTKSSSEYADIGRGDTMPQNFFFSVFDLDRA
jgi:hypothetical protein